LSEEFKNIPAVCFYFRASSVVVIMRLHFLFWQQDQHNWTVLRSELNFQWTWHILQ